VANVTRKSLRCYEDAKRKLLPRNLALQHVRLYSDTGGHDRKVIGSFRECFGVTNIQACNIFRMQVEKTCHRFVRISIVPQGPYTYMQPAGDAAVGFTLSLLSLRPTVTFPPTQRHRPRPVHV